MNFPTDSPITRLSPHAMCSLVAKILSGAMAEGTRWLASAKATRLLAGGSVSSDDAANAKAAPTECNGPMPEARPAITAAATTA